MYYLFDISLLWTIYWIFSYYYLFYGSFKVSLHMSSYSICPTYSISPFMYILFDISFYVYIQYLYICPIYSMSLYMPHLFDILIVALLTRYLFLCTIYSVFSSFPIYSISTFLDYLFEVFPISPLIYYSIFPISLSVGDVSQSKIW